MKQCKVEIVHTRTFIFFLPCRKNTLEWNGSNPPIIKKVSLTIQAMNVQRNLKVRSRNFCFRGKAINTSSKTIQSACLYSCLSYPPRIWHLFGAVSYFDLCPVWLCHVFLHYLIRGTIFWKKLLNVKGVF